MDILTFYKYSWAVLRTVIKLLAKSLILSGLLIIVKQDPSDVQYRANYFWLLCKTLLNMLPKTPGIMTFVWLVETNYVSGPTWVLGTVPSDLFECFLFLPMNVYSRTVLANTWGRSFTALWTALFVQPCSTESCLVLPNSRIHLAISGRLLGSSWRSPLSALCPGISLKTVSLDYCRAHLIFSPSLGDHRPSLPDAQCLKNHHFIYFAQLLVGSNGLVYSALLINPSCSEGNM